MNYLQKTEMLKNYAIITIDHLVDEENLIPSSAGTLGGGIVFGNHKVTVLFCVHLFYMMFNNEVVLYYQDCICNYILM